MGLHASLAAPSCVTLEKFLSCPWLNFPTCKMEVTASTF